ncbi:hypothetical protein PQI51_00025 [Microbacterium esteraromaticum]|jgi:hypothetical protein|uniref:hypothetical protein n=1 Tax=Microbacterium esteraromaticum TaxID=57043 RepID=UPI0030B5988E
MAESSSFGRFLPIAVPLTLLLAAAGCSSILPDGTPGNPVGTWTSNDGLSFLQLDSDGGGLFTLCRQEGASSEGLKYRYSAEEWPSSIPVTWETENDTTYAGNVVRIFQDWSEYESTGVGFDTIDRTLIWINGELEMSPDFNLVYVRSSPSQASCK